MTTPKFDAEIVIATHSEQRPIRQAVESVLDNDQNVGAIVVAHCISASKLDIPSTHRVRVIEHSEGKGFPGAPFNRGIRESTADYVGRLDSDDVYEPGAVSAMLARAKTDHADGVIAPLRHSRLEPGFNPLTLKKKHLDPVKDRLFYRTAPMGLFRGDLLRQEQYQYYEDIYIGEDFPVSGRLWTGKLSLSHYPKDPAYVVGEDSDERLTTTKCPLPVVFSGMLRFINEIWVKELSPETRDALAIKLLRVHILGVIRPLDISDLSSEDLNFLCDTTEKVINLGVNPLAPFSSGEKQILVALSAHQTELVLRLINSQKMLPVTARVFADTLTGTLHRESNIRRLLSTSAIKISKAVKISSK